MGDLVLECTDNPGISTCLNTYRLEYISMRLPPCLQIFQEQHCPWLASYIGQYIFTI